MTSRLPNNLAFHTPAGRLRQYLPANYHDLLSLFTCVLVLWIHFTRSWCASGIDCLLFVCRGYVHALRFHDLGFERPETYPRLRYPTVCEKVPDWHCAVWYYRDGENWTSAIPLECDLTSNSSNSQTVQYIDKATVGIILHMPLGL